MANSIEIALKEGEESKKYGKIISSVLLTLRSNVTENKVVVIVEGADDRSLYERMYDADKVMVYPVSNCRHTVKVVKAVNDKGLSMRLIGIKDADFDHLNGTSYPYENLFLTDFHDAEIVELENNITIDMVWYKYTGMRSPLGLKDEIYSDLFELSLLKWYNYIHRLNIVFKKDKLGACVTNGIFDYSSYKTNLFSRSDNVYKDPDGSPDYKSWCSCHGTVDKPELTNGHDAVELLFHKIKMHTKQLISIKDIAESVRNCYPSSEYKKTGMAMKIDKWAKKNYGTTLY